MKINRIITGIILFTSFMVTAQTKVMKNPEVMFENPSRYNFTETIDLLSKTIVENGWKITATHDLQETMKKNGKTVLPVKVIELCNPTHAFEILGDDAYRDISPMLPCRISVYEKADGLTYISRMNAPALAAMIGGKAAGTIVRAYEETEVMLKTVLK